jgi:hypothetical protein
LCRSRDATAMVFDGNLSLWLSRGEDKNNA